MSYRQFTILIFSVKSLQYFIVEIQGVIHTITRKILLPEAYDHAGTMASCILTFKFKLKSYSTFFIETFMRGHLFRTFNGRLCNLCTGFQWRQNALRGQRFFFLGGGGRALFVINGFPPPPPKKRSFVCSECSGASAGFCLQCTLRPGGKQFL